ncbi:4Fe-4S cluster-binding domain-containing protein [Paenibacillus dakarensis]|uniref:4Fe-4S cluster-binding domain-containing protein n=1 Tax=Paenibacillus dakarensis TaxID=1527293 RepID=UPI000A42F720|nr:4Fe-4S cluster-binding domain-containing protein [Paenibacillus dakarensis]
MSSSCMTNRNSGIGVMWKTVSEDCNLACDYCYYSTCGGKPGPKINRIESAVLDKFIKDYMQHSQGSAIFAWQGGEPLLAG